MKTNSRTPKNTAAFTRKDLLIVVAIIALVSLLASMLLPALGKAKAKRGRIPCVNNQKQIGTAFRLFSADHNELYPLQATNGSYIFQSGQKGSSSGAVESDSAQAWQVFQSLWQYLPAPKVLICPEDVTRAGALKRVQDFNGLAGAPGAMTVASFGHPANQNLAVSYAPQALADESRPIALLTLDRNINFATAATASKMSPPPSGSRFVINSESAAKAVFWVGPPKATDHAPAGGNLCYADGSVAQATAPLLQNSLLNVGTTYGWGTATSNGLGAAVFLMP